jgi:CRP-like cAMP-binding protein
MAINHLQGLDLFSGFSDHQLEILQTIFLPVEELDGRVIFKQGDLAESIYLIIEGDVSIQFKPDDGPVILITNVRDGGVIGWSAVVGSPVYTSSAVCTRDTLLLRAGKNDLQRLCRNNPRTCDKVIELLAAVIAERLRNTHQHVVSLLQEGLKTRVPISTAVE